MAICARCCAWRRQRRRRARWGSTLHSAAEALPRRRPREGRALASGSEAVHRREKARRRAKRAARRERSERGTRAGGRAARQAGCCVAHHFCCSPRRSACRHARSLQRARRGRRRLRPPPWTTLMCLTTFLPSQGQGAHSLPLLGPDSCVVLRRRRAWVVKGGAGAEGVGASSEAGGWTGGQPAVCACVCVDVRARRGGCREEGSLRGGLLELFARKKIRNGVEETTRRLPRNGRLPQRPRAAPACATLPRSSRSGEDTKADPTLPLRLTPLARPRPR